MQREFPVAKAPGKLRDRQISNLPEPFASVLLLQIPVLIQQARGKPHLPYAQAHDTYKEDHQPLPRGQFP